jgi:hypothetical protein
VSLLCEIATVQQRLGSPPNDFIVCHRRFAGVCRRVSEDGRGELKLLEPYGGRC